jgi:hypothetical protein
VNEVVDGPTVATSFQEPEPDLRCSIVYPVTSGCDGACQDTVAWPTFVATFTDVGEPGAREIVNPFPDQLSDPPSATWMP